LARRFQQEVTALETISHPNVVGILAYGATPKGSPYLVMEFIEGHTLRDELKDGAIPPQACASLIRQIGGALHELHSHGIYHRDVKPENIMIRTLAPINENAVLVDFSMAIVRDPDMSMHGLSRAGGTVHYMAPEQALGHGSGEADIYSLAKVVIEMMTGKRLSELLPDAGLDLSLRVRELLESSVFGLSSVTIDLVANALEFDPGRRPGNVKAFTQTIADELAGLSRTDPFGARS
jgi:serine/threonine protein kinase